MSRNSHSSRGTRPSAAGILAMLLVVAGGVAWWASPRESEGAAAAPASPPVTAAAEKRATDSAAGAVTAPPSATTLEEILAPMPVPAGHDGHGDECAECLGRRKLDVYRADYARLQLSQLVGPHAVTPEETREILAACYLLARRALLRWSFSESRPVLAPDEVVESLRQEILGPYLTRFPAE